MPYPRNYKRKGTELHQVTEHKHNTVETPATSVRRDRYTNQSAGFRFVVELRHKPQRHVAQLEIEGPVVT